MNFLRQALADYLAVRRALGYSLLGPRSSSLSSSTSSSIVAKNI
jgi:hypothetical protein